MNKKEKELIDYGFKKKMEALKYMRETEKMKHAWSLERSRIKSAEIRKSLERQHQMKRGY